MLLKTRLEVELGPALLTDFIVKLATKIGEKVLKLQSRECFESLFEYLACFIVAIKLKHGLNDDVESAFPE